MFFHSYDSYGMTICTHNLPVYVTGRYQAVFQLDVMLFPCQMNCSYTTVVVSTKFPRQRFCSLPRFFPCCYTNFIQV